MTKWSKPENILTVKQQHELPSPYSHDVEYQRSFISFEPVTTENLFSFQRYFAYHGPTTWNYLPLALRYQQESDCFKRALKTHLLSLN